MDAITSLVNHTTELVVATDKFLITITSPFYQKYGSTKPPYTNAAKTTKAG